MEKKGLLGFYYEGLKRIIPVTDFCHVCEEPLLSDQLEKRSRKMGPVTHMKVTCLVGQLYPAGTRYRRE